MKLNYRSVWISDVHLGTRGCKAEYLLDFLDHIDCQRLYLVGDIVDFWKLKNGFYWPALHNAIVRKVMALATTGTEVIYIPGNHDEVFRGYIGTVFNGIALQERAVHETADGRLPGSYHQGARSKAHPGSSNRKHGHVHHQVAGEFEVLVGCLACRGDHLSRISP